MARSAILKIDMNVIIFCRGWSDWDKISETSAEWHVDCSDVVEIETRCRIPIWRTFGQFNGISSRSHLPQYRVLPPGEFNVMIPELRVTLQGAVTGRIQWHVMMSSQSHVSQCRVLPLGEFTVMIPEPHATLQGAVTWWNQCHDRATLQGVRIPSAILKFVCRHTLFFLFLMQFRLWRAAAFVSSPIHLLHQLHMVCYKVGELRNRYDAKLVHFKHFFWCISAKKCQNWA